MAILLRRKGTDETFPYTDLLSKRPDMEVCDPNAVKAAEAELAEEKTIVEEDQAKEVTAEEQLTQAQAAEAKAEAELAAAEAALAGV